MRLLCIEDVVYDDPAKIGTKKTLYKAGEVVECHLHADCIHDRDHFRLFDETVSGEWFFSHFEFTETEAKP